MEIVTIPLNTDNYGYLLIDTDNGCFAIIDVSGEPHKIISAIDEVKTRQLLVPQYILTTHKHFDHAGGNKIIKECIPEIEVLGSQIDDVEGCTRYVEDNEEILIGNIRVRCILTPGHTMGHISYFISKNDQNAVFTGDCLFVGGAGKFFEGTGFDMFVSLYEKLGVLPSETKVYCGHEYTLSNYKFALSIDPDNQNLKQAIVDAENLRNKGLPTVPSTIGNEKLTNPFMRVYDSFISQICGDCNDPIAVLTAVREAKNNFR
eukprot:gene15942-21632_t